MNTSIEQQPERKLLVISIATIVLVFLSYNIISANQFEFSSPSSPFIKEIFYQENILSDKRLSILCLVMTRPTGKDVQDTIIETWGSGCTDLVFFIGDKNASEDVLINLKPQVFKLVLAVEDAWDNTWMKVRAALKFVNNSWNYHFDWVLRIDDDAYVIFSNLRQFLSSFDPAVPVQLGAHYAHYIGGYIGTGPGIAISRVGFHNLMQSFDNHSLCNTNAVTHNDDVELGNCLKKAKVPFGNSSDSMGRLRFIPIRLNELLMDPKSPNYNGWFASVSAYPVKPGLNCCSDELISLHYVKQDVIRLIHTHVKENRDKPKNLKLLTAGWMQIPPT